MPRASKASGYGSGTGNPSSVLPCAPTAKPFQYPFDELRQVTVSSAPFELQCAMRLGAGKE